MITKVVAWMQAILMGLSLLMYIIFAAACIMAWRQWVKAQASIVQP